MRQGYRGRRGTDETGGIITGWLFQLVVIMALLAVVGYEIITVAITAINLDDDAREVAIAARDAYRDRQDLRAAERSATAAAERIGAELVSVQADDTSVRVTVRTTADTLFIDRIGALDDVTERTADARAPWRS